MPVDAFSVSIGGKNKICDPVGNVWQWIEDDFNPLPGFSPDPLYMDFSQPYFGSRHKMLLGGSWATTGTAASLDYRLWFRPNFYQHAGFRLIKGTK
jgi:formylglycine-generating enzyme required for sulfatase activity